MKNYRIQLASNYQVIEFNLVLSDEEQPSVDHPDVESAVEFINELGKMVDQPSKGNTQKKPSARKPQAQRGQRSSKEEMASESQLDFLEGLGYQGEDGWELTKEQANRKIKELKGR